MELWGPDGVNARVAKAQFIGGDRVAAFWEWIGEAIRNAPKKRAAQRPKSKNWLTSAI